MRYAFGGIVLLLLLTFGIGWAAQGNDFFVFKFFAPKYEQVRYDTFKQSQAFNDGMAQQLDKAMSEYARTTDKDQKAALGSIISHQFAGYDPSRLTSQERSFLGSLQTQQIGGVK